MPTQTPAPTSTLEVSLQPSALEIALAWAPLEFANKSVTFADYAGSRAAVGFNDKKGVVYNSLRDYYQMQGRGIYEGLARAKGIEDVGQTLYADVIPPTLLAAHDLGIWYYQMRSQNTFVSFKGRYDEELIADKLVELGYSSDTYQGNTFYRLYNQFPSVEDHPILRERAQPVNRMVITEDSLLAGPSTETITTLVDLQQGQSSSLADSEPHRMLAKLLGRNLLSGEFWTPEWVIRDWLNSRAALPVRVNDYLGGPDRWEILSPYITSLIGYRFREGKDEIAIGIFYSDIAAASRDELKLQHRWESLTISLLPDYENFPVINACANLSTDVSEGEGYSVLVASCQVERNEERKGPLESPSLWMFLQPWFLYPDLEELKQAAESQ